MDSGTAGSKQERRDEISNGMKSMMNKICWKKDFVEKNIQDEVLAEPRDSSSRCVCILTLQ